MITVHIEEVQPDFGAVARALAEEAKLVLQASEVLGSNRCNPAPAAVAGRSAASAAGCPAGRNGAGRASVLPVPSLRIPIQNTIGSSFL